MKNPKMPSPVKQTMPTAPLVNAGGLLNQQNERRRQRGVFSTLMGSGSAAGDRLRSYLDSSQNTSVSYTDNTNPTTRVRSGMEVKK